MSCAGAAMGSIVLLLSAFPAQSQREDLTKRCLIVLRKHFEVNSPEPLALVARRVVSSA